MSINKRQFDLLQAMGITVWQRRDLSSQNSLSSVYPETVQNTEQKNDSISTVAPQSSSMPNQDIAKQTQHNENIAVDLKALLKHQLFKDIISSVGTSSADLSITHNQIDLGIINWQFTLNKTIEFKHNCLKTPDLTTLANSPELKKSLWQSIATLGS